MGAREGHHVIVNGALAWVPFGEKDPPERDEPKPSPVAKASTSSPKVAKPKPPR